MRNPHAWGRDGVGLAAAALLFGAVGLVGQTPVHIAPDAPKDQPISIRSDSALTHLLAVMQPWVDSARRTYPAARRRYLAGLPAGESFFVTTRPVDDRGKREQVFVAVDSIAGPKIYGRIWSRLRTVRGFRYGESVWLGESELVDWLITHPDGTEEGNVVGKFLDRYEARSHAGGSGN